jgi:hypothetical protein
VEVTVEETVVVEMTAEETEEDINYQLR